MGRLSTAYPILEKEGGGHLDELDYQQFGKCAKHIAHHQNMHLIKQANRRKS